MKKTFLFATIFIFATVAIVQYCMGKKHPRRYVKEQAVKELSDHAGSRDKAERPVVAYTDNFSDSAMCFPLRHDNIYSLYSYVIDLKDERIIDRYKPIFDRNDYEFTGYAWEGLLKQILSTASKEVAANTFIHAQEDIICFTITRYQVKQALPEYICPILSSQQLFASYIRKADRNYVNNY